MGPRKTIQVGKPARYQDVGANLCKDLKAHAVVLIVIEGRNGSGFSVSTNPGHHEMGQPAGLASLLRRYADIVEAGEPAGIALVDPGEPAN